MTFSNDLKISKHHVLPNSSKYLRESEKAKKVVSLLYTKISATGNFENIEKRFEALKNNKERFATALDLMSTYDVLLEATSQLKNSKESVNLKNQANRIFVLKKDDVEELFAAWALYTKSIAMAPDQSVELSISYANRSAVLFHMHKYRESLEDINRALNMKYPDHLKGKLFRRKAECFKYLYRSWLENINISVTDEKVYEEKLISISNSNNGLISPVLVRNEMPSNPTITHPHKKIPCASDAVSLKYSQKFGKHLAANRKINVGEILIIEQPFTSVLLPEKIYVYCAHCLKIAWAAVPCEYCVYAIYCSQKCKNESWMQYHDIECSIFGYFVNLDVSQLILLSLRIIITAVKQAGNIKKLKKTIAKIKDCKDLLKKPFADDGLFHNEKYETVYTLETNTEKRSTFSILCSSVDAVLITYYLYIKTNFFESYSNCNIKTMSMNKDAIFIGGLILHNLQVVSTNAFYCNTIYYQHNKTLNTKPVGSFIAGFLSLLNHSCIPNALICPSRRGAIVYAVRPINKGSQIYCNYGFHFNSMDYLTRKQQIMKQYYFECECIACTEKDEWLNSLICNGIIDINAEDMELVAGLIDKSNLYKKSVLEATITDREKAIADVSNIIEVLVKRVPLLYHEIFYVVDILRSLFNINFGI